VIREILGETATAGLIALCGWISNKIWDGWTALFFLTIILTSITGFPLPPFGLDPPRMVGILSLIGDRGMRGYTSSKSPAPGA
jgi:hypothetical protein